MRSDGGIFRHRQQFPITPHALWTRLDGRAGQRFLYAGIVVNDLQRAKVELANVRRRQRVFPPALAALEGLHESGSHMFFHHSPIVFLSPDAGDKKPLLTAEKRLENPPRLFSSFLEPLPAQAGIGTWSLQIALQPVAVASWGQSLNHSR